LGPAKPLFRIMVCWGAVSTLTMLIRTPAEFYAARMLLGMAEAGFFPGILLYLTYWFPSSRRNAGDRAVFPGPTAFGHHRRAVCPDGSCTPSLMSVD